MAGALVGTFCKFRYNAKPAKTFLKKSRLLFLADGIATSSNELVAIKNAYFSDCFAGICDVGAGAVADADPDAEAGLERGLSAC